MKGFEIYYNFINKLPKKN